MDKWAKTVSLARVWLGSVCAHIWPARRRNVCMQCCCALFLPLPVTSRRNIQARPSNVTGSKVRIHSAKRTSFRFKRLHQLKSSAAPLIVLLDVWGAFLIHTVYEIKCLEIKVSICLIERFIIIKSNNFIKNNQFLLYISCVIFENNYSWLKGKINANY